MKNTTQFYEHANWTTNTAWSQRKGQAQLRLLLPCSAQIQQGVWVALCPLLYCFIGAPQILIYPPVGQSLVCSVSSNHLELPVLFLFAAVEMKSSGSSQFFQDPTRKVVMLVSYFLSPTPNLSSTHRYRLPIVLNKTENGFEADWDYEVRFPFLSPIRCRLLTCPQRTPSPPLTMSGGLVQSLIWEPPMWANYPDNSP